MLRGMQVKGGGSMRLRSSDPDYLAQVDAWWDLLLPKLKRFMHVYGGPVLMVQVRDWPQAHTATLA